MSGKSRDTGDRFRSRMQRLLSRSASDSDREVVFVPGDGQSRQAMDDGLANLVVEDPRGLDNPAIPEPEITRQGDLAVYTTRFGPQFQHGAWRIHEVPHRPTDGLDVLEAAGSSRRVKPARNGQSFSWEGAAFLDTETTSLSSGSGVLVFLTAVGAFEGDEFVVRQYLMESPDPDVEQAYLASVGADLMSRRSLVTFFGKAFDQHRLLDRSRVARVELPIPEQHFDLYWLSRRMVGGRYENLKLRTLEHELLGFFRLHDLPGSAAPEAYFQFLRGSGDAGLKGVLLHNLLDVVSLVSLAAELSLRWESPRDVLEHKARGQALLRAGVGDVGVVRELVELLRDADLGTSPREWLELATFARRCDCQLAQREALLEARARAQHSIPVLVELAKFYEHRERDPVQALDLTELAMTLARPIERGPLERRRSRLRGLVSRQA